MKLQSEKQQKYSPRMSEPENVLVGAGQLQLVSHSNASAIVIR